jgi:hypothetical protein
VVVPLQRRLPGLVFRGQLLRPAQRARLVVRLLAAAPAEPGPSVLVVLAFRTHAAAVVVLVVASRRPPMVVRVVSPPAVVAVVVSAPAHIPAGLAAPASLF